MVKRILLAISERQFSDLQKLKGKKTWEQFLVTERLKLERKQTKPAKPKEKSDPKKTEG